MIKEASHLLAIAAALLACAAAPAWGQVVPVQTGNELDANYQLGSGGRNVPVGPEAGFGSQLYITGQVRGLAAFGAGVPYSPAEELRIESPTASLDVFRRQSVGLPDVLAGPTYAPTPYYNPTLTAFSIGGIREGLALPGSSQPPSMAEPAALLRLYVDATRYYEPVLGLQPAEALQATPLMRVQMELPVEAPPLSAIAFRPGAASAFGIPSFQARQELARELYEVARPAVSPADEVPAPAAPELPPIPGARGAEGQVEPGRGMEPVPSADRSLGNRHRGPIEHEGELTVGGQVTRGPRAGLPPPNQDIYIDILMQLRAERQAGAAKAAEEAPPAMPGEKPFALVERAPDNVLVLHSFAGKSLDSFNLRLARADRLLRDQRYYEAATQYEHAVSMNSTNPLARMGLAAALFAAGEPMRAGFHIRRAMQLFPPIMETRLDVADLLETEQFKRQLKLAADRLQTLVELKRPEPLLALSVAYIARTMGQADTAARAATLLKELAADDALLASYAEYVLTGKRPSEQAAAATTGPSSAPTPASAPGGE